MPSSRPSRAAPPWRRSPPPRPPSILPTSGPRTARAFSFHSPRASPLPGLSIPLSDLCTFPLQPAPGHRPGIPFHNPSHTPCVPSAPAAPRPSPSRLPPPGHPLAPLKPAAHHRGPLTAPHSLQSVPTHAHPISRPPHSPLPARHPWHPLLAPLPLAPISGLPSRHTRELTPGPQTSASTLPPLHGPHKRPNPAHLRSQPRHTINLSPILSTLYSPLIYRLFCFDSHIFL